MSGAVGTVAGAWGTISLNLENFGIAALIMDHRQQQSTMIMSLSPSSQNKRRSVCHCVGADSQSSNAPTTSLIRM